MIVRRNKKKLEDKVIELKRWQLMKLDWVSSYYCVSKTEILRSLIQTLESTDKELKESKEFLKGSRFFNKRVLFHLMLTERELFLFTEVAKNLEISQQRLVGSLLLTRLDLITKRLDQNLPRNLSKDPLQLRQLYFSTELVDDLYTIRDERGESVSLLLKEAVLDYRQRVLSKLPCIRKERNLSLRLSKQEWSKLDQIAVSSEMPIEEAVASILINHYFGDSSAQKTNT